MKTLNLNIGLGNGWILVSISQDSPDSKILNLVLNKDGKTVTTGFDRIGGALTTKIITLTNTQLHIITTAVLQFLA